MYSTLVLLTVLNGLVGSIPTEFYRCEFGFCKTSTPVVQQGGPAPSQANPGASAVPNATQTRQLEPAGSLGLGIVCSATSECMEGLECSWNVCQYVWSKETFEDGRSRKEISRDWKVKSDAYGKNNRDITPDPEGDDPVLRIAYPRGSAEPSGYVKGGTGFYAAPMDLSSFHTITLVYQVYFPEGFKWVKGGKLPGLYGGRPGCSGGDAARDCFSTRKMWRANGKGEAYIYFDKSAQEPNVCRQVRNTICNDEMGYSIGRGSFSFTRGSWTTVREVVSLNTFTGDQYNKDGGYDLYINDNPTPVFSLRQVVWRTRESVQAEGIQFETFFGGNGADWASPVLQYTYFKGILLSGY